MRWLRHLVAPPVRSRFQASCMERIQAAIAASESTHGAEICFAVERALAMSDLLAGTGPRARAESVFGQLGVWDTESNNGVLVYVLLAEHAVEIVADRGARSHIDSGAWKSACDRIALGFSEGRHVDAVVAGIEFLTPLLAEAYPRGARRIDRAELPDTPITL